jgi:hypothetical protein
MPSLIGADAGSGVNVAANYLKAVESTQFGFNLPVANEKRAFLQVSNFSYNKEKGETQTKTFEGLTARCFLHELDHMNGIVYTDRTKPLALQLGLKKLSKLNKKMLKFQKYNLSKKK